MESSTAIVLVESASCSVSSHAFNDFVQCLHKRRSDMTSIDGLDWSAFPLEEVLAAGLWPVLIRMSQKMGMPGLTTIENVRVVSGVTSRYLDIGLDHTFGSPEVAAQAFITLIHRTSRELIARRQRMPQLFTEVWFKPVGGFFGAAIKRVFDTTAELETLTEQFKSANKRTQGKTFRILASVARGVGERGLWSMGIHHPKIDDSFPVPTDRATADDLLRSIQEVRDAFVLMKAFERLPYDFSELPDDAVFSRLEVDGNWLTTQLLLSVHPIDLKQKESRLQQFIEQSQLVAATSRFASESEETILDCFVRRMEKAGFDSSSEMLAIVGKRIGEIKKSISKGLALDLIIRSDQLFGQQTHESALGMLTDFGRRVDSEVRRLPRKQKDRAKRNLVRSIDWSQLTAKNVEELVQQERISLEAFVRGIEKLMPEAQAFVADRYFKMHTDDADRDAVRVFLRLGLFPDDMKLIGRHAERFPEHETRELIHRLLRMCEEDERRISLENARIFTTLASRTSSDYQRELMERADIRSAICAFMVLLREDFHARKEREERPGSLVDTVLLKWRVFCWPTFISELVIAREDVYKNPRGENLDPDVIASALLSWRQLAQTEQALEIGRDLTREQSERVLEMFGEYPEESVFRWRFIADPDLDGRWSSYKEKQAEFRKRYKVKLAPRRSKRK